MPLIGTTSSDKKKAAQEDEGLPASGKEDEAPAKRPTLQRPKTKRQFTSELDLAGLKRFQRAEARMLALNPQGSIDFYLSGEGFSQYWDMILSHASYWHDVRFATFVSRLHSARLRSASDTDCAECVLRFHSSSLNFWPAPKSYRRQRRSGRTMTRRRPCRQKERAGLQLRTAPPRRRPSWSRRCWLRYGETTTAQRLKGRDISS